MQGILNKLCDWGFSLALMGVIFILSGRPGPDVPNFGTLDYAIKKGSHAVGYGLLAISYWRGLRWHGGRAWLAWLMAVLYACTDEIHQVFVPGRHPSIIDVALFDNLGAAGALWCWQHFARRRAS